MDDIEMYFFVFAGIGLFFWVIINPLSGFYFIDADISLWPFFLIIPIAPAIYFSHKIWQADKENIKSKMTITKSILLGSLEEREKKLIKYKKQVSDIFYNVNKTIDAERQLLEKKINSERNSIELKILKHKIQNCNIEIIQKENSKRGASELFFLRYL